jgi:hypothetical protein
MEITNKQQLQQQINLVVHGDAYIDRGVQFLSEYYGVIQATNVTDYTGLIKSIYGFDLASGSPRDCYYPRDLTLLGFPVDLGLVLQALNKKKEYFKFNVDNREDRMEITFSGKFFEWEYGSNLDSQNSHTVTMLCEIFDVS